MTGRLDPPFGARIRKSKLAGTSLARRACAGAFVVGALVAASAAEAGSGSRQTTTRVGRGVHYTFIRDSQGPWRIQILSVRLSARSTLDVALAGNELNGLRETTSSMARRHRAIAAINGDFGWHRPMHSFAEDGHLVQTSPAWGGNFAVDKAETAAYFKGAQSVRVWTEWVQPRRRYAVRRVNAGRPEDSELALFSPVGSTLERPPRRACSARLYPLKSPREVPDGSAVQAVHNVAAVRCGNDRMSRMGGKVLAARRSGVWAQPMSSLRPGDTAGLAWSLGGAGVFDTLGGYPPLIKEGKIQWEFLSGDRPFYGRHPRTGVGYDSDKGTILLVTVDGRRPGYSVGMTLRRFAIVFKSLGAEWALNLDGGGSTTTVVRGKVRNRPSDGSERPVSSALLVLPGRDDGESANNMEMSPAAPFIAPPAGTPFSQLMRRVTGDPGSTGGLASALRDRGFELPTELKRRRIP